MARVERVIAGDLIIEEEFFARFDWPQTDEPDMAAAEPGCEVGRAGVVDELRAAASDGAVDQGSLPGEEDIELMPQTPAARLGQSDTLTRVLNDAAARGDGFSREDAPPVDGGTAIRQPEPALADINVRAFVRTGGQHNLADKRRELWPHQPPLLKPPPLTGGPVCL